MNPHLINSEVHGEGEGEHDQPRDELQEEGPHDVPAVQVVKVEVEILEGGQGQTVQGVGNWNMKHIVSSVFRDT